MKKFIEMYTLWVWLILVYDTFIIKFVKFICKRIHGDWKHIGINIWRKGTFIHFSLLQFMNSTTPCVSDMPLFYTLRKKLLLKLTQCLSISTFILHIFKEFLYTHDFSLVSFGDLSTKVKNNSELRIHTSPFFTFGIQLSIIFDPKQLRSMFFHIIPPCHQSVWNATLHKHCCLWDQLPSFKSNACFANCVAGLWIVTHAQAIITRSKLQLGWEQL